MEKEKEIAEIIFEVLLKNNPDRYSSYLKEIKSCDDIVKYSKIIKESRYSEKLFDKILDIIVKKQKIGGRYKRNECFKIIKRVRKANSGIISKREISKKIFFLFQSSILLIRNEEIANSLSVCLKDCLLEDHEIKWLIDHSSKNTFILNRILRYPTSSKLISEWAASCLQKSIHLDRKSEIIGWILDINHTYEDEDLQSLVWGVYYSRCSNNIKKQILSKIISVKCLPDIVEVCDRMGFLDVLEKHYLTLTQN